MLARSYRSPAYRAASAGSGGRPTQAQLPGSGTPRHSACGFSVAPWRTPSFVDQVGTEPRAPGRCGDRHADGAQRRCRRRRHEPNRQVRRPTTRPRSGCAAHNTQRLDGNTPGCVTRTSPHSRSRRHSGLPRPRQPRAWPPRSEARNHDGGRCTGGKLEPTESCEPAAAPPSSGTQDVPDQAEAFAPHPVSS